MHGLGASSHLTARFVVVLFAIYSWYVFEPRARCHECHVVVLSLFPLAGVWVRDTIE